MVCVSIVAASSLGRARSKPKGICRQNGCGITSLYLQPGDFRKGRAMKGAKGIVERSKGHFAIIIEQRDPATGKRKPKWITFRGTKKEAEVERARLLTEI